VFTNLLEFLEVVTSEADKGSPIDIVYLDFSKAFDKVPKLRLMEKLAAHSINGNVYNWIKNWLTDRTQRTVLNGKQSEWADVWSGVPQGSVLGPVLFLIFINDIDFIRHLITVLKKFADDTKLGQKILNDSDRQNLQDCLDILCEWANKWGMQFNISKCKVLHIGRNNPKHIYTMNNIPLTVVEEEKDIGVLIHHSLKPSRQCSEAARKANAVLGQISRSFHYRDKNVFMKLYKSHVRSHLEFSVPAWSPWTEADKLVLENVQKRAVRMVSGLSGSYEENLKDLNLQSLEDRRLRYDMIQTYKIIKEIDAVQPSTWFNLAGDNPTRRTRLTDNPINILPSRSRLEIRNNFFSQRVPELWNNLPESLKNSRNLTIFKRDLTKHMRNI
jgi:ribonucleases P/MRP protein subunit RPP40